MKKVMAKILISSVLLGTSVTSYAGFNGIFNSNGLKKPSASYELDTYRSNSEVYEFTPVNAPNTMCVVFILDNLKATSMQCFPKDTTTNKK